MIRSAYVGGVVGYAYGGVTITGCINEAVLSISLGQLGGIAGHLNAGDNEITCCVNRANLRGLTATYVGGIIGYGNGGYISNISGSEYGSLTIDRCYNTGSISGAVGYAGGMIACMQPISSSGFLIITPVIFFMPCGPVIGVKESKEMTDIKKTKATPHKDCNEAIIELREHETF